jgi:hypothetical protein
LLSPTVIHIKPKAHQFDIGIWKVDLRSRVLSLH